MKLIAILLSLWADRRFPDYVDLRQFSIYNLMAKVVLKLGVGGDKVWIPYLLLTVLPAWILMMTISALGIVSLLEMLLWAVALYLCLPSEPLGEKVQEYLSASRAGADSEIHRIAESILESEPPESDSERDRAIVRELYAGASLHVVSLFLWFSLLGIGGAFFYRFNWQLATGSNTLRDYPILFAFAERAMGVLTWIPARLLALAYGVAGKLGPAFTQIMSRKDKSLNHLQANHALASNAGFAAAGFDETSLCDEQQVEASWKLIKRANIVLLVTLGLIIVYRWI